jgi:hypothetical protein
MNKIPFSVILVTCLSLFGFIYLLDLRITNPEIGNPIILALGLIYLAGVIIAWRNKK